MAAGASSISWGKKIPLGAANQKKAGEPLRVVPPAPSVALIPMVSLGTTTHPLTLGKAETPIQAAQISAPPVEMGAAHGEAVVLESVWTVSIVAVDPSGKKYVAEFDAVFPEGSCLTALTTKKQ